MSKPFGKAIVIGGSMAGLWTARALADFFERVTVVERDQLPSSPEPRKGVAQGRHIHVLLEAGRDVLDELFPGLVAEMQEDGLSDIDFAADLVWHHFGVWKKRFRGSTTMLCMTRPYLEWNVRKRIAALSNVIFRPQTTVEGFLTDDDGGRITGVRIQGSGEELRADLVIDATGRGSQTPQRLDALGYEKPPEETVGVELAYTSRIYQPPEDFAGEWKFLVQYPRSPDNWRAGFIMAIEGGRWIVSLNGYFRDHAPTDEAGFNEFARSLSRPDLYQYIQRAQPLTEPVTHKIPVNRWRRYDKPGRFPEGLIVLGDAVCALNPIFGQGMSVAAKEARLLHRILAARAASNAGDLSGIAQKVRKGLPGIIGLPWFLTRCLDLHYPQATGKRPIGHGLLMWYIARLLELNSRNEYVYSRLSEVLSLKRGLGTILVPSVSLRVLAYGVKSLFVPLEKRANTDVLPAPVS